MTLSNKPHLTPLLGASALIFAALMLIPGINAFSMWLDEVNIAFWTQDFQLSGDYFTNIFTQRGHPPLYFALAKLWTIFAGIDDFVLRAFTLFWVMLAAALAFRIAVDLSGKRFAGFAAAVLFGSMGFVRYYTYQNHNYGMLLALSLLLVWTTIRWWNHPSRRGNSLVLVAATLALLFTHYYGAYVVVAVNAYVFLIGLREWKKLLRWILLQASAAVAFAPWFLIVANLAQRVREPAPTGRITSSDTLLSTFDVLLSHQALLYGILLLIGIGCLAMIPAMRTRRHWWRPLLLLGMIIVVSVAVALLVNLRLTTFRDRRVIYLLAIFAILLAYLLSHLPARLGYPLVIGAALISWTASWSSTLPGDWHYRQIVSALNGQLQPGDVAYLQVSPPMDEPPVRYYAERMFPETVIHHTLPQRDLRNPHHLDRFLNDVWLKDSFWVLRLAEDESAWSGEIPGGRFIETAVIPTFQMEIARFDVFFDERQQAPQAAQLDDKLTLPLQFGGMIELVDYQIERLEASPGGSIRLWLDWRALQDLTEDYTVFVQLLTPDRASQTGSGDSDPSHLGRIVLTSRWPAGKLILDEHLLQIDAAAVPGDYMLHIGWYRRGDFMRLRLENGQDSLALTAIRVD